MPSLRRRFPPRSAALFLTCLMATALSACGGSSPSSSITFGTVLQNYSLRHERSSFGLADTMAWVATFASPADPGTVTATIARADAACSSGRRLASIQLPLKDPTGKRQAYAVPVQNLPAAGIPIPGTYTLRYSQAGKTLADGTFSLTGPPFGTIEFGQRYVNAQGGGARVTGPTSTFSADGHIAWVAYFAQPPNTHTISIAFDRVHGCSATRLLRDDHVRLSTAQATSYANRVPVRYLAALGLAIPGSYIVTYTAGGRFLARGEMTLTK